MVPKHNDDPYSDDDEQEEEPAQKTSRMRTPADSLGVRMPLKLTSSLTSKSHKTTCSTVTIPIGFRHHQAAAYMVIASTCPVVRTSDHAL